MSLSTLGNQLIGKAQEYETVQLAGSYTGAFDVYSTLKKIESAQRRLDYLCSDEGRNEPQLIRKIHAEQKFIRRCYLKVYSSGLRMLQFGSLLIPHPVVRMGVDNTLNIISNSVLLERELTTRAKKQCWKDKAYQLFKITASSAGLISGALTIGYATDIIDEKDSAYQTAITASFACGLASFSYAVLQTFKLVANRD